MIEVIKPGLLDLVMDLGRAGFRAQGVPTGGAADAAALVAANRRLNNPDNAAGLELMLVGPALRFVTGGRIALAGAKMPVLVDGVEVGFDAEIHLVPGAILQLGRAAQGLRTYLAVAGGLDVPLVMGSRSTFLPGGFGGIAGRPLRIEDRLAVAAGLMQARAQERSSKRGWSCGKRDWSCRCRLRVLPGAQIGGFNDAALGAICGQRFQVRPESNRVGVRLAGARLAFYGDELPSQGVLPGAIQVPPDGQPIVLGWDGPVTGGYPVIACVIAADLWKLAQARPGDTLYFEFVTREQAIQAWREEDVWN